MGVTIDFFRCGKDACRQHRALHKAKHRREQKQKKAPRQATQNRLDVTPPSSVTTQQSRISAVSLVETPRLSK